MSFVQYNHDLGSDNYDITADWPTDVGLSLMSDAEKLENRGTEDDLHNRIRERHTCAGLHSCRSILEIILLLTILALLVEKMWEKPRNQYDMSGDLTGFVPRCKKIPYFRSRWRCLQTLMLL